MMRLRILVLCVLVVFVSLGCSCQCSNETTKSEAFKQNGFVSGDMLAIEDFNVKFGEIVMEQATPFEETAVELGVVLGDSDVNTNPQMLTKINDDSYGWYTLSYPSIAMKDVEISYLYNETLNTAWIVWLHLFNGETNRGMSVGCTLDEWKKAYGMETRHYYDTDSTDCYEYKMDPNAEDKEIRIIVDRNTNIVKSIFYNYCSQQSIAIFGPLE